MSEDRVAYLPDSPYAETGRERLWNHFGLSYASWLALPRVIMHEMPDEWQGKMADLLKEYTERTSEVPDLDMNIVLKENGKYKSLPKWLEYRHPSPTVKSWVKHGTIH